jgi:L-fuculose-phosphate aldolase
MKGASESNPHGLLVDGVRRLMAAGMRGDLSISSRAGGGLLIASSAVLAEAPGVDDIVFIARDGGNKGRRQPPLDAPMHQAIYNTLPDVQAVVHVLSTHAAALASLQRPLPAFHHRVAIAGGDSVPCVAYSTPGSAALSQAVVEGLGRRHACLLAHDGLVATGTSLMHAVAIAVELELLCQMYLAALPAGEPPRLERGEIARVLDKLQTYARTPWA